MLKKPHDGNVESEWKCIKELVITAKGAETEDLETVKASDKAHMREGEASELRSCRRYSNEWNFLTQILFRIR